MPCLFCKFVNKSVAEHKSGYPFYINYETRNTISFLTLDSPVNNEAHLLVIPKRHFKDFHSIPHPIKAELIEHVSNIGKLYSANKWGYNILLNNSEAAGQFVPHSHFHVIPRKRGDRIKIEVWKRKKISPKEFKDLAERTRKKFERIVS
jgi:histidine triad (HIT) family protein